MGQTLRESSALHFMWCMDVLTKARAAWQGDGKSCSGHLQENEQC